MFALMLCPRMMFVSGDDCVSIELRIVLKSLNSMLSTGWYIEYSVMFNSPLIFFSLSSVFGKVSGTPMILPSIFLPVCKLITSLPFFLCTWLKVGDRMMHTPPMTHPLVFVFVKLPWK